MVRTTSNPSVINDFWTYYKDLEKYTDLSGADMKVILTFFSHLKKIYENFAGALRVLGENFHKEISKHYNTEERAFSYYHYLGNYVLKVSEMNKSFSQKIDSVVFAPYSDFAHTLDTSNHEALEKVYKILLNIESSTSLQKKHQDTFYKLSRTAEKMQENFAKLIDENKTEDMIMKAQDKMIKIKMEAQEAGQLYRQQISSTNQWWKQLYSEYQQAFKVYDENEDSKTYYNRNSIIRLVKFLDEFYHHPENEALENLEEKFKEIDEKSTSKQDSFKTITSGKLDTVLQNHPEEEYLSYEAKRKLDEANIMKSIEEEEYGFITETEDMEFIREYVKTFHPKGALTHNTSIASTTDHNESVASEDSILKEKEQSEAEVAVKPSVSEANDEKMKTLISNSTYRKYLIDSLVKQRDPVKDQFEIKLPPSTFHRLQSLLSQVLKELINENEYDIVVQFLPLGNKYYTIRERQEFYFYRYLRTLTIWEDPIFWSNLMRSFYEKKAHDENQKQKKTEEIEKTYSQPQIMNKLWSFGKQITAVLEMGKKPGVSEAETYVSILHEIGFYLSRLTKNIVIASEVLMRLAFEVGVEKHEIVELVHAQKREIDEYFRERIKYYPITKAKKAQNKWGQWYPVYLCLDYLEPVDLVKLLTLNQETRKIFKKKVYRTVFYNYGDKLTSQQRFKIWWNVLDINELQNLDYKKFLEEYQSISTEKSVRSVEDVIQIDVLRSFNKHANCDPKLLQALLQAYAAYDKEVSYCQGMNYVMGFLYINTQDPEKSFKGFVRLMDRFMRGIFGEEFKVLKSYFFKFNRILDLFAPDLAEHFKKEKVDSSFYIPSWFITVYANSFQYALKSKMLEKIWDFFLLDGMKVIFKVGLLILMEYKDLLMEMKFDGILHFLGDLQKEELFKNIKFFEVENGEIPEGEAPREYKFIKNLGSLMGNTHVTKQLLKTLDGDFDVLEVRLGRLNNLNKKK